MEVKPPQLVTAPTIQAIFGTTRQKLITMEKKALIESVKVRIPGQSRITTFYGIDQVAKALSQ